jgi:hypothetical protein
MAGKEAFSKNVDVLAYLDLDGKPWFQMAMQEIGGRYYLYGAHFQTPGFAIVDVTDPSKPEYLKFVPGPALAGQSTPKIQVADGLLILALGGTLPMLHGTKWGDPYKEGVMIYDVSDPVNPKLLSTWDTDAGGGGGVHRFFYNGGRYVHLSASCKGFKGFIYRILDIVDPTNPVEVGRWWMPDQWAAGYMEPKGPPPAGDPQLALLDGAVMHGPAYPKGDLAYVSWGGAGMVILDISDITLPKLVGQLRHHPPFAGKFGGARCHTVLPLSERPYAVMTSEGERFTYFNEKIMAGVAQPLNFIGMVDTSDPTDPTLISVFPYPEIPEAWPYKNFNEIPGVGVGPFGPHNIHEPHYHPALEDRNDRIYCCYFHAGLRIYDINDPFVPKELAYFIPPDPDKWAFNNEAGDLFPGPNIATTEDVIVDNRGNIFIDTSHQGMYVLRCKV